MLIFHDGHELARTADFLDQVDRSVQGGVRHSAAGAGELAVGFLARLLEVEALVHAGGQRLARVGIDGRIVRLVFPSGRRWCRCPGWGRAG